VDIQGLSEAYNAAVDKVEEFSAEWDGLAEDADEDAVTTAKKNLDDALQVADEAKEALDHAQSVKKAREKHAKVELAKEDAEKLDLAVREPDMYQKPRGGVPGQFLQDLYFSQIKHDPAATERIGKHQAYEMERYAIATGTLGGIIPPQYLVDLYAKAQRYGRVFADQCRSVPLPPEGMSLVVPRLTQGLSAAVQTSESSTVSTQDVTETDLTVNVRTVAGYSPVSRQTLERASYSEQILFEDLIARYNAALDTQCISGTGASGQHLGVLYTASISTATVSSWTVGNFYSALVGETGVIQAINSWVPTTGALADKIVMHPRRWGAVLNLLDSNSRPLFAVDSMPNYAPMGEGQAAGYGLVGHIAGLDVYIDANISTTYANPGTNQDYIIVMASQAALLWERADDPVTLAFEQQAGTSLQTQLVCYGYSAFTAGRYPAAVGVISGAGLT